MFLNQLRDPLAYPAGEMPGIDYNHIGCSSGKLLLSSVTAAVGSNKGLDLSTRSLSTSGSNSSFKITTIGPSIVSFGSSEDTFIGRDTTAYTAYTGAFIAFPTSLVNQGVIQTTSTNVGGVSFGFVSSSGLRLWIGSPTGTPVDLFPAASTLPNGINHPYFVALSCNTSTSNFVAVQLDTGQMITTSSTGLSFAAGDGTYLIGNGRLGHMNGGYFAATMVSAQYTSLQDLKTWAEEPWSFWYPKSTYNYIPDFDVGVQVSILSSKGGSMMMMGV